MHIVVLSVTTPCRFINSFFQNGGIKLTISLLSLPRIGMSGSIPPRRLIPSWRTQRKLYLVTFIYSLFNVVVGRINLCRIMGAEVNDELKRMWKLVVMRILGAVRHLPSMSEAKEDNPSCG
jgi:hypothetical protein